MFHVHAIHILIIILLLIDSNQGIRRPSRDRNAAFSDVKIGVTFLALYIETFFILHQNEAALVTCRYVN